MPAQLTRFSEETPQKVCLLILPGVDFYYVRRKLQRAMGHLVEEVCDWCPSRNPITRALIHPHPNQPQNRMVYSIRFNDKHPLGPLVQFHYPSYIEPEILQTDPRREAIIRVARMTGYLAITTDCANHNISLPFLPRPRMGAGGIEPPAVGLEPTILPLNYAPSNSSV